MNQSVKFFLFLSCLYLLTAPWLNAQLSRGGKPLYAYRLKSGMEWISLGETRAEQWRLEDQWAGMTGAKGQQIARELPLNISPSTHGTWTQHNNGTRIWRCAIRGEGAFALAPVFSRYQLREGVRLFVSSPSGDKVLGAFTRLNNKLNGRLAVGYLEGEEMILQLEVPPGSGDYGQLLLGSVRYAYRPVFEDPDYKYQYGISGDCNVNINCPEGAPYQVIKNSVVRLLSVEKCSGVLINNTAEDGKPLLLTAAHCIFSRNSHQLHDVVFYFDYESPYCNADSNVVDLSISGFTLLATGDTGEIATDTNRLDFALLELSLAPPDTFTPYYAGWNRDSLPPDSTATIHHPQGDVRKITLDSDPPDTNYHKPDYFPELISGSHWRIHEWDLGTTEGGSSGAPLLNPEHQVIGVLTGGVADCINPVNDYYTRFDYAWDYYPEPERQLKYWLDSVGLDLGSLGGHKPYEYTALPGIEAGIPIRLYPVPSTGRLTLEYDARPGELTRVRIFNASGSLIRSHTAHGNLSLSLDLSAEKAGLYILQVNQGGKHASRRFILAR